MPERDLFYCTSFTENELECKVTFGSRTAPDTTELLRLQKSIFKFLAHELHLEADNDRKEVEGGNEVQCKSWHEVKLSSCSGSTTASITPRAQSLYPEDKELLLRVVCLGVSLTH